METKITHEELRCIGACTSSLAWVQTMWPELETTWGILIEALRSAERLDWLRWLISEHASTPVAVLEALAQDQSWNVRYAVARNAKSKHASAKEASA